MLAGFLQRLNTFPRNRVLICRYKHLQKQREQQITDDNISGTNREIFISYLSTPEIVD